MRPNSNGVILFQAWKSAGIHIEDHLLTYLGPEHCSSCSISPKDFHGARYKLPFSNKLPKFEVYNSQHSNEYILLTTRCVVYTGKWSFGGAIWCVRSLE